MKHLQSYLNIKSNGTLIFGVRVKKTALVLISISVTKEFMHFLNTEK